MRILLDTQVWLWMLVAPERLRAPALELIRDPATTLLLSAASTWEIAIKSSLGLLDLGGAAEDVVPAGIEATRVSALPVLVTHTLRVAGLPQHHKDPFDRLLVAQAQLEAVPILTADRTLGLYDVELVSAA